MITTDTRVRKSERAVARMARYVSLLALLVLLSMPPSWSHAAPPDRISVAYSVDSIPFQYTDDNGDPNGIIIDYWKLWSDKTGIAVDFVEATWNETLVMVRDGKVDAHAGLFFNEERDTYLDYGAALIKTGSTIFMHDSVAAPGSLDELSAYRVGVLAGDYVEGYLQERMPLDAVVGYPDYDTIMAKLRSGELKVFVADKIGRAHV